MRVLQLNLFERRPLLELFEGQSKPPMDEMNMVALLARPEVRSVFEQLPGAHRDLGIELVSVDDGEVRMRLVHLSVPSSLATLELRYDELREPVESPSILVAARCACSLATSSQVRGMRERRDQPDSLCNRSRLPAAVDLGSGSRIRAGSGGAIHDQLAAARFHGGVICGFLECAMSETVVRILGHHAPPRLINLTTSFLGSAQVDQPLRVRTEVTKTGRRFVGVYARSYQGSVDLLVAKASALFRVSEGAPAASFGERGA
ncbi:MAG: PaaI family thioesterase [Pseudomonadales bacterium]